MKNPKIRLETVTVHNWKACIALELKPEQRSFVSSNLYSIAEAQFYPEARSRAVMNEQGQMVGYILFGRDIFTDKWKIFRLMIDKSYQGQGHGESALREVIAQIGQETNSAEVLICYQEANSVARRLYARLGFQEIEVDTSGKVTASLQLK